MRKRKDRKMGAPEAKTPGSKRWGLLLRSSAGYALPMVLIISFGLTISGMAFLTIPDGERRNIRTSTHEKQALYFAEAGIRKALWRMNQGPIEEMAQWATFSDSTMSVTYADVDSTVDVDSTQILISVGNAGGKIDTIRVEVHIDPPSDHVGSYTDAWSNDGNLVFPEGNGPAQFQVLPTVDMGYYLSIADSVYYGDQSFDDSLSAGIHFIYGKATIRDGTVLDGSIVATDRVNFKNDTGNATISAQQVPAGSFYYPAYYPAVITLGADDDVESGKKLALTIKGLVYSAGEVCFKGCELRGPIIATDIDLRTDCTVTYDSTYALRPPGFTWPAGSFVAEVGSWSN